jgi:cytochrome c oxidase subunit II
MSGLVALFVTAGNASPWDFPLFPKEASTGAVEVDHIYFALVAFALVFTVIIAGLILYFAVKYRAGSQADRSNPITQTLRYELVWIAVPTVLSLGLFAWAAKAYLDISVPPRDARTIYVVAKQWMWKIQHPEGRREIDELHVPVGVPIKLVMTSQDVIHSFFVPEFRVKQDVLPDRYTTLWFKADRVGVYHLFCAQYCGAGHSAMIGRVVVMKPADYQAWLSAKAPGIAPVPGSPGTPGASLAHEGSGPFFKYGCNSCHLPTSAVRAPRLDGLYGQEIELDNGEHVIADEQYIRESILDPQAKIAAGYASPSLMPTYRGQVDEQDIRELIEFIKSLKDGWPAALLKPEAEPPRVGQKPAPHGTRGTASHPEGHPR